MSIRGVSAIARPTLIAFLFVHAATSQAPREDWKSLEHAADLAVRFSSSLEHAPLTSQERAQIYRVLKATLLQGTPAPDQRQEILSAKVGPMKSHKDGKRQVAVQAPATYCGATGNCSLWIFYQNHGSMHLALQTEASVLIEKEMSTHGFQDLATYGNVSAAEGGFNIYRWNGTGYKKIDCYHVKFNIDDRASPPEISECPK